MVVEVFIKGSNFKKLYDTFWNVKEIKRSSGLFILTFEPEKNKENISLDIYKYEFKVC